MPDITISADSTEQIIPRNRAIEAAEDPDVHGWYLEISGNDIRLARGENKEQARHGSLFRDGDVITSFEPNGHEVVAHSAGAQATVHVSEQWFSFGEVE